MLARLVETSPFVAAHKAVFFGRHIKWCGRINSVDETIHDTAHVKGLLGLRRPETGGEPMHFLQAVNWIRCALPDLDTLEVPLREILEDCLGDRRRVWRAGDRWTLTAIEWTPERNAAQDRVRQCVAEAVPLYYPREGYQVPVFSDVSDSF